MQVISYIVDWVIRRCTNSDGTKIKDVHMSAEDTNRFLKALKILKYK